MNDSLTIQSHFQLFIWLQGDFQEALQHDIMISFSRAPGGETLHYDIVSPLPGLRTAQVPANTINNFLVDIHQRCKNGNGQAETDYIDTVIFDKSSLNPHISCINNIKQIMFHSIPDTRFEADHLYILLRQDKSFSETERKHFELLLPHVDAAVRKLEGLPVMEPDQITPPPLLNSLLKSGLTTREIEILEWVRNGKTNIEIGIILDISSFTVKNHLQRIFRKMNVSNRAQAVGKLEALTLSSHSAQRSLRSAALN